MKSTSILYSKIKVLQNAYLILSPLSKIPTWRGRESVRARPALDAGVRVKSRKREINDREIYISAGGFICWVIIFKATSGLKSGTIRIDRSGGLLKDSRL